MFLLEPRHGRVRHVKMTDPPVWDRSGGFGPVELFGFSSQHIFLEVFKWW